MGKLFCSPTGDASLNIQRAAILEQWASFGPQSRPTESRLCKESPVFVSGSWGSNLSLSLSLSHSIKLTTSPSTRTAYRKALFSVVYIKSVTMKEKILYTNTWLNQKIFIPIMHYGTAIPWITYICSFYISF